MTTLNNNKTNQFIFWSFLILLILTTNQYFSLEEVYLNGARDGKDYFSISSNAPEFSKDLAGHRSWRFMYPFIIGNFSNILSLDIFLIYQITTILILVSFIYLINKNSLFNKKFFENFIFISCILFNPYFFRYFIALPLIINDLMFVYGTLYLILFLKKERLSYLIIGLIIACFARQEAIFFVLTIAICKFIFKKRSIFSNKHLYTGFLITFFIFSINTYYSVNSSSTGLGGYSDGGRFALFNFNYTLFEFVIFFIYLIFPFLLIFIVIFFNKKNFIKNIILKFKDEKIVFIFILSLFILAPAIIAGPEITGKNILRLSNLPILLITYLTCLLLGKLKTNWSFNFIFFGTIFIFLQHPKYSLSNLFSIILTY